MPVWNELFEFHGVLLDLVAERLRLHVWDSDLGGLVNRDLGSGTAALGNGSGLSNERSRILTRSMTSKDIRYRQESNWAGKRWRGRGG